MNHFERLIYETIMQIERISVRDLQKIVCDPENPKSMGHPTFLKYLKNLEEDGFLSFVKLGNKKLYSIVVEKDYLKYDKIEKYGELEYKIIENTILPSLTGIEILRDYPEKQFRTLYNCLLQLFGYQNIMKVLRGVGHPEGEENNAMNEFFQKLEDLEENVYQRTSPFMSEPILAHLGKVVDDSFLELLQLLVWKWNMVEKLAKKGDKQAIGIKNIYLKQYGEDSYNLLKRLKKELKSHTKISTKNEER